MKKKVIFGPPGTGKTTYLMKLLEAELTSTPANRISFVSFTKQGTYEGVHRAIKKFKLSKADTVYFRTIHSLCFSAVGAKRAFMVGKPHYKLLSDKTGINFTGFYTEDFSSTNDVYLHILAMEKHNPKYAATLKKDLNFRIFKYVEFQYNHMKKQLGLLDFDDLLIQYLETGKPLDIDVAFVDEGQDLTPLQWKVVKKLFANAQVVYVAGDDDQAVYEWSGANVSEFLSFSRDKLILNQSYRLPKNVLKLANKITSDIKRRQVKKFKAKDAKGKLSFARSIEQLSFKGGELVLARTNWLLKDLSQKLLQKGVPCEFKGRKAVDKITVKAIKAHIDYEKGKIPLDSLKKFSVYFDKLDKQPWQKTIKLTPLMLSFYRNYIGVKEDTKPVVLETYHSCKGSENEHVILLPEISKRVHDNMFKRYDAELRCLYVGMTRTKSDLTLILPNSKYFYPTKYFKE